jgi:hypothetical protein
MKIIPTEKINLPPRILRIALGLSLTILAGLALWQAHAWSERALGRPEFLTGYSLLAVTLAMLLLSLRKRLLVLPLGRMAFWQQFHHYLGLFGMIAFVLHAGWTVHGILESMMAIQFWAISISGLCGWYLNYKTPKLLRSTAINVLREDILLRREELAQQAYTLALQAAGKLESATIAEHYLARLQGFFQRRRSLAYCLIPNGRKRRLLLDEIDQLGRYLGPVGVTSQTAMRQLVQQKDDLDFQWALQNRLRGWVIVHLSLIWSFYFVVACHIYTVYAFHGF